MNGVFHILVAAIWVPVCPRQINNFHRASSPQIHSLLFYVSTLQQRTNKIIYALLFSYVIFVTQLRVCMYVCLCVWDRSK